MGLCKCPRKKVTNLYCFEHRVNVCEYCLVDNHNKCVIQSYLSWLEDSDYDPTCLFCKHPLTHADVETIRLPCLHIYHWQCFNRWASSLPPTTAPAGYNCPACSGPVFPKPNQVSPVITQLRQYLERANWARAGLGLDLLPELTPPSYEFHTHQPMADQQTVVTMESEKVDGAFGNREDHVSATTRKPTTPLLDSGAALSNGGDPSKYRRASDADENKYARRSATEWFSRWLKSRSGPVPSGGRRWSCKRTLLFCIMAAILVLTLGGFLSRAGRSAADSDPFLNPMANPNIRVDRISNDS